MSKNKKIILISFLAFLAVTTFVVFFTNNNSLFLLEKKVEHKEKWGIYAFLDLGNNQSELIYLSIYPISRIRLNNAGDKLVFSQQFNNSSECIVEGSPINFCEEICSINVDGIGFVKLTNNNFGDLLSCWSKDDSEIFFLSFRETLDIFKMDADGKNMVKFYDSGFHDSDLSSSDGKLVFTRNSQIWTIKESGTELAQVTDPPRAGEWGTAVLPFGDYDPNLNPEGNKIVFERLVNDETNHGNYNIYLINLNGSEETAITNTGYTQGLPVWSHSGKQIVFSVGAIGNQGKYDIYLMNSEGLKNRNITPEYFPADFLCHDPIFSKNDSKIIFIGEWYTN